MQAPSRVQRPEKKIKPDPPDRSERPLIHPLPSELGGGRARLPQGPLRTESLEEARASQRRMLRRLPRDNAL
jgi:hypothetical protein